MKCPKCLLDLQGEGVTYTCLNPVCHVKTVIIICYADKFEVEQVICKRCGAEVPAYADKCPCCGAKLEKYKEKKE